MTQKLTNGIIKNEKTKNIIIRGEKMKKKLLSLMLALSMLISTMPFIVIAEEDGAGYATRGYVADKLLSVSDDYNAGITRGDIIKGYGDGDTKDDQYITRSEAVVMADRAFGKMPEPDKNFKRISETDLTFSDVPDWAEDAVNNLASRGILVGKGDGLLGSEDFITEDEVTLIIRRLYYLFGSNLKDDFQAYINKDYYNTAEISQGNVVTSSFHEVDERNDEIISDIINNYLSEEQPAGSNGEIIADFYTSVKNLNTGEGTEQDIEPLKPYLDEIDKIESLDELDALSTKIVKDYLVTTFAAFAIVADFKDNTKNILAFGTYSPSRTKADYENEDIMNSYKDYLTNILVLGGADNTKAAEDVEKFIAFEKDLSQYVMSNQEASNIDNIYNLYSYSELCDLFPAFDFDKLLEALGLHPEDNVLVTTPKVMEAFASYVNDKNIDLLKTILKISVLSLGSQLDKRFIDAANDFESDYFGMDVTSPAEDIALTTTKNTLSSYLSEEYIKRNFSDETKKDVENMVNEFIDIFRSRIANLTWMGEATKEKAIRKIDAMSVNVGYPESFEDYIDDITVYSPNEKYAYFNTMNSIRKSAYADIAESQGKPAEKADYWSVVPVYTVNAGYMQTDNSINFPAGILQEPFYYSDGKPEENLGSIGTVIAHEITHAFDNNGAKFDEFGNAANWWTEEDLAVFEQLCQDVVNYYNGFESAPGIQTDGELTISENVADIGGMACALDAMKKLENPDYKLFFESNAKLWKITGQRQYLESLSTIDVHSFGIVRANRLAALFDEFYEAFDITEEDGMYVAPENRVSIW